MSQFRNVPSATFLRGMAVKPISAELLLDGVNRALAERLRR